MSSFVALNIEPDDESEEEIDDTKEIQIEEALKLYLTAIKLHSQGAEYYPEAKDAYDSLFKSEIFKYPESLSEYQRSQQLDLEHGNLDTFQEANAEAARPPKPWDSSTASALPQTIYLSYKNHGQFILDSFRHANDANDPQSPVDPTVSSGSALKDFAEALERDDTDLELWRKSARVGDALRSYRIARYCLESVIDGNGEGLDDSFDQQGLEQAFAVEALRKIVHNVDDELSKVHLPLKRPRRAILQLLKAGVDPVPYLASNSKAGVLGHAPQNLLGPDPSRLIIAPASCNWVEVGKTILEALVKTFEGETQCGSIVEIRLPGEDDKSLDRVTLPILQRVSKNEPKDIEERPGESVANNADVEEAARTQDAISNQADGGEECRHLPTTDAGEKAVALPDEPQAEVDAEPEQDKPTAEEGDEKAISGQTRKRSSTSAGNEEPADGGRTKSRRIRARESNAEAVTQPAETAYDQARYFEDRLEMYTHADQWMFGTVGGLLSKFGVEDLGTIDELKRALQPAEQRRLSTDHTLPPSNELVLFEDLRNIIENWDDAKAGLAMDGDIFSSALRSPDTAKASALSIFLEHSRQTTQTSGETTTFSRADELSQFCQHVNLGKYHLQGVALKWLEQHLVANRPAVDSFSSNGHIPSSSYATEQWPESMKDTVNEIILKTDELLYRRMLSLSEQLEEDELRSTSNADSPLKSPRFPAVEFSQTVYELHLNLYASMTASNNELDNFSITLHQDRISRWRYISRTLINQHMDIHEEHDNPTVIALRHLWATTLHLNMIEEVDQEHVLLCFEDLKRALTRLGVPVITLANNEAMSEISVAAVDREVSRLKSKEFFISIFDSDADDPVHLIESVEPILDPTAIEYPQLPETTSDEPEADMASHHIDPLVSRAQNMTSFLDQGDPTLKLFLWRRLQEAYDSIQYPTKSISCRLRSIEVIVQEFSRLANAELSREHRQTMLLKWLKMIDVLLSKLVGKVLQEPESAFECFDMDHLRSSMTALARVSRLLHTFAAFEDALRIGQVQRPDIRPAATAKSLEQFRKQLRTMQVNAWVVQYALVREGINQSKEIFDTPLDDRIHYLRSVHNALGLREYCKYSDKLLLKLARDELLTLQTEDGYESDIAQVLFDLYGLKFSPNLDAADHGCPIERLDRSAAIMMTDFVMLQTYQLNAKDLSKSELKMTIDTVQKAIGWPSKSVPALAINKRILSNFLRSPVNPQFLIRSVRGIGGLSMLPVSNDYSNLANKGWFFLHGSTALAKFRSQKRLGPTPTDDLDLAASFFKVDIELGAGRWETWYRLAQVYDLKLEEDIAWSADKLNNHRADLGTLQRKGIHAYAMAIAESICTSEPTTENRRTISDIYREFGFRMYASSREPLSMDAFSLGDSTKHFSNGENQQMYTGKPFNAMSVYSALNLASYLFRQAMVDRPKYWVNHYMFSKCLWKMFNYEEQKEQTERSHRSVDLEDILDSLDDAIDCLPSKKEPILEPYFKLVSIVHKLVKRRLLHPREASEKLLAVPWARSLRPVDEMESWKPFILEVLKGLRNADKSNWHHRIVARIAHIIYDDVQDGTSALAAKNELSQHIFTKAMTIQVWRPENERGGRHFVYTARYAHFFTQLLDQLNDRANLELLLRRVRKKPHDFLNHSQLWEFMSSVYVKVFRRVCNIPPGRDEAVFKPMTYEEFIPCATRLENSCQGPEADSGTIDMLRDAVDLKKLNAGLMKSSIFEDLIADTYAVLYEKNATKILESHDEENRERMKVDHILMTGDDEGTRTPTTSTQGAPSKGRTKGVTRKELQRKADAIATKSMASRQAVKPPRPVDEVPRASAHEEPSEDLVPKDDVKAEILEPETSLPISLHDSGDDESELSEIDDDKLEEATKSVTTPMFPNLQVKQVSSPKLSSEPSANVSADGGDAEPAPPASSQDTKSEQAPPPDSAMDVDG